MNGLASINVELTSHCSKSCWMCGRRKLSNDTIDAGNMPLPMVKKIARQVPAGVTVQLHNNGDPLCYPHLKSAIRAFNHCVTGFNTNAKLLTDKADDIKNLDALTISIIPEDPEGEDQLLKVQSYLELDIEKPKMIIFRFLGDTEKIKHYKAFIRLAEEHGCFLAFRQLHAPAGSFEYESGVTMPEMGICLEMLHKLSIDRYGNVSPCVRFDPYNQHVLGNLDTLSLQQIWNGTDRKKMIRHHLQGRRDLADIICASCHFYGIPRG